MSCANISASTGAVAFLHIGWAICLFCFPVHATMYFFKPMVSFLPLIGLSLSRSAMPFGGFQKAAQLMTFQMPDIEVATEDPEPAVVYHHDIGSRPSFNRTPIGWGGSAEPGSIHMELDTIPFDVETDDL